MSYFTEDQLIQKIPIYESRDALFSAEVLRESRTIREHYDFFISHSSADFRIVQGLYNELKSMGFSSFLDRVDAKGVDIQKMANYLKRAMDKSDYVLYAHTHNSIDSKWVPWELGYFDSNKGKDKIFVMPIINDNGKAKYIGQEYLSQYEEIEVENLDSIEPRKQRRKEYYEDIINGMF